VTDLLTTTLGSRIRKARKDAGYKNVESISVQMGVGARTFQRWEADTSEPSLARLREIAALTNHTLAYFISTDESEAA
jgi:transcriptional regulator with XRE-family HTH domain